jgi:hypothetical protein
MGRIKREMCDEMAQVVAGMSRLGSRIETTRMVLQPREIATATVIDSPIAKEDGETRSAMIGQTEAALTRQQIVVTGDGIETETKGKSASQSGWMSQLRTKAKFTLQKTFRSGESNSKGRIKLARHQLRM